MHKEPELRLRSSWLVDDDREKDNPGCGAKNSKEGVHHNMALLVHPIRSTKPTALSERKVPARFFNLESDWNKRRTLSNGDHALREHSQERQKARGDVRAGSAFSR